MDDKISISSNREVKFPKLEGCLTDTYLERLDDYFSQTILSDSVKIDTLMSNLSDDLYDKIKSLCTKEDIKDYKIIIKKLKFLLPSQDVWILTGKLNLASQGVKEFWIDEMIEIGRKLDSIIIKLESDNVNYVFSRYKKFNKNNDSNRNNDKNLDIQSKNEINSNYNRPNYYSRQNFDCRNRNYGDNSFSNVNDNRNRNFSNVRNNNNYNNNNYKNNQYNDNNYQNYNYRYIATETFNNNYQSYNNNYGRNNAWFNYNQRRQIQCDDQNNNYRSYNNNLNNYEGNNRCHNNDNQINRI
ncbi:TBC1 domain family member 5 homolog A-like [Gordionus sp. m RMFG-2023]|uniref:TBC1 domain family member 5 homolog A-like n=1 Tax=Gordionus sp. m RMFG-2023 TaxID=3053472 RepID=UPI0031FDEC90